MVPLEDVYLYIIQNKVLTVTQYPYWHLKWHHINIAVNDISPMSTLRMTLAIYSVICHVQKLKKGFE